MFWNCIFSFTSRNLLIWAKVLVFFIVKSCVDLKEYLSNTFQWVPGPFTIKIQVQNVTRKLVLCKNYTSRSRSLRRLWQSSPAGTISLSHFVIGCQSIADLWQSSPGKFLSQICLLSSEVAKRLRIRAKLWPKLKVIWWINALCLFEATFGKPFHLLVC